MADTYKLAARIAKKRFHEQRDVFAAIKSIPNIVRSIEDQRFLEDRLLDSALDEAEKILQTKPL